MIYFFIPELPKTPNQLLRRHWSTVMNEKKMWHRLVARACFTLYWDAPMEKAKILFIRRSTREPDYDGLTGSFKFVLDGLVKAGVLIDDKPSVVDVTYKWEKSKRVDQGIFVQVENMGG